MRERGQQVIENRRGISRGGEFGRSSGGFLRQPRQPRSGILRDREPGTGQLIAVSAGGLPILNRGNQVAGVRAGDQRNRRKYSIGREAAAAAQPARLVARRAAYPQALMKPYRKGER